MATPNDECSGCMLLFRGQSLTDDEQIAFSERFGPLEATIRTVRELHMLPRVRRALRAQRTATDGQSVWVFPNDRGGALNITNLRERVWRPAIRRAGLRERTMYQTRHTFATLALSSGEALDWVSKMLGHRTTQMVIRHYQKYVPNLTRRDGDALARAVDKRLKVPR